MCILHAEGTSGKIKLEELENQTALDNTDRKCRSNCRDMIKDSRMFL